MACGCQGSHGLAAVLSTCPFKSHVFSHAVLRRMLHYQCLSWLLPQKFAHTVQGLYYQGGIGKVACTAVGLWGTHNSRAYAFVCT